MDSKDLSGPRYWKSLDDLSETPAFKEWVEREFPAVHLSSTASIVVVS